MIIKCNKVNYVIGRSKDIEYIVIHFTGKDGDTARKTALLYSSGACKDSMHYFVDDKVVVQSVMDSDTAYHIEKNEYDCVNSNSISVCMCTRRRSDGRFYFREDVLNNTVDLVLDLMEKYNVPPDNVLRHFDCGGVKCPEPFVRDMRQWETFKYRITPHFKVAGKVYKDLGLLGLPQVRETGVGALVDICEKIVDSDSLDKRIKNGIRDIDTAIDVLFETGILADKGFWKTACAADDYAGDLILKAADKSKYLLWKIVEAEARDMDLRGRVLVCNVVLNRVKYRYYADSVYGVVFQPGQFGSIRDGRYAAAVVSDETKRAVDMALEGCDDSLGALFFCRADGNVDFSWHERICKRLFEYDGMRFYK